MSAPLSKRWYQLLDHAEQERFRTSVARFRVVAAGRRSGKTELSKRILIKRALEYMGWWDDPCYFAAGPTRDQAKRIFWNDLKLMTAGLQACAPSESELTITLLNGAKISVIGLDKPARIEGSPWNGGVITEMANVKPEAWAAHIRPALSERQGWCILESTPEGENHFHEMWQNAKHREGWDSFHWESADIIDRIFPGEIEQARQEMDEATFNQEYRAQFVIFTGRAYPDFIEENYRDANYSPHDVLSLCFDFNVSPGVCCVVQEKEYGTQVVGEVYIPNNSTTPKVCETIIARWGKHKGHVHLYGDATGGARGSAKVMGSDWDLIKTHLQPAFGARLKSKVPRGNGRERARVNAVNSRIKNASGLRRLFVDGKTAPMTAKDLRNVKLLEGGAGQIDKDENPKLTHISDALGYYVVKCFPVAKLDIKEIMKPSQVIVAEDDRPWASS